MSDEKGTNRHSQIRLRSYKLLDEARLAVSNSEAGYNCQQTCSTITKLFQARSGKTPYDWQLDVTEAILLGLDSIVIAGLAGGMVTGIGHMDVVEVGKLGVGGGWTWMW